MLHIAVSKKYTVCGRVIGPNVTLTPDEDASDCVMCVSITGRLRMAQAGNDENLKRQAREVMETRMARLRTPPSNGAEPAEPEPSPAPADPAGP